MTKAKPKSKPKTPAKVPGKERTMDARGHIEGSRKGKVHALYDKEGPEAAFTLAQRLGLKPGTARSWLMVWKRTSKPAKATKVAKPKVTEKKPETKPDKVEATVAAVH